MGSIYQRGKNETWYYQYYRDGKLHKKSLKTTIKATAISQKKILDGRLEQVKSGVAPKRALWTDAFKKFMAQKEPVLRDGTLLRYKEMIATFSAFLEEQKVMFVHKITYDHLTQYISKRQGEGRANKTIRDELAVAQGAIKMLIAEGTISESPIKKWPSLKITAKHPERLGFYSASEITALIQHFEGKPFYGPFLFFAYTGCRRSEARAAKVRDVRLSENTILLANIKTATSPVDQYRKLPIHPVLLPLLKERIHGKKSDDFLFPELQAHSRNWPQTCMEAAAKALGINYRRLHGLRHSFITLMLSLNVPIRTVMDWVGHEQFETTLQYAGVEREGMGAHMAKLDFGQSSKPILSEASQQNSNPVPAVAATPLAILPNPSSEESEEKPMNGVKVIVMPEKKK